MAHIRKQIRDAAVVLLTGLATTGANVFAARDTSTYALAEGELPALVVEVINERSTQIGVGGGLSAPTLCDAELRVRILAKSVTGYADTIDAAAVEVQSALADAGRVGGVSITAYVGTDGPFVDSSTDRPVASAEVTFMLRYVYAANDPETVL